jgi:hypothetical protein
MVTEIISREIEILGSHWDEIKVLLREKFSNLTSDDLRFINGRYDHLMERLEERYGYSRAEAEEVFHRWFSAKFPNFFSGMSERSYGKALRSEEPMRNAEPVSERSDLGSNFLKWLLALGIPLAFILGYYAGEGMKPAVTTPTNVNQERVVTATPADQTMIQTINRALAQDPLITSDLSNLRIISSNGVVTVSGVVPSVQQQDEILKVIRNTSGVQQINNQLVVR